MLEERLRDALFSGAGAVEESPDLFARVQLSIEDDRRRRSQRRRAAALGASVLAAVASIVFAVIDNDQGDVRMDWWILELLITALLIGIALWLGPFIKRFGKTYAADVFRANPGTGKSFIVLTDFAYYLIFLSYILFTSSFEATGNWEATVNAAQLKGETARVAGILLIIGILHGLNLIALPVMGRLLTLNRRLDQDTPTPRPPEGAR
jgi:hypothetical protein